MTLYVPPYFLSEDWQETKALAQSYPFATLISYSDGEPYISHLPFAIKELENSCTFVAHMAAGNPHTKVLQSGKHTLIFHGPHTYITPVWYTKPSVPTWNYVVAHIEGDIITYTTAKETINALQELTKTSEANWPSGWTFDLTNEFNDERVLMKSILAFEFIPKKLTLKKKLSQNRSPVDQEGVRAGLKMRSDENSQAVLHAMHKLSK
ncbi:MAG: FMN-binding negative transcriptional regulator [Bdellovibrionaceae bacterium]|nr:FMN-binding negative transcriptional regulator [Pseudobdellovibrionaceae bacterium]